MRSGNPPALFRETGSEHGRRRTDRLSRSAAPHAPPATRSVRTGATGCWDSTTTPASGGCDRIVNAARSRWPLQSGGMRMSVMTSSRRWRRAAYTRHGASSWAATTSPSRAAPRPLRSRRARQLGLDSRAGCSARDPQGAAEDLHPVTQPAQPRTCGVGPDTAAAVVHHVDGQRVAFEAQGRVDAAGVGVLDDVGERLRGDEVRRALDRAPAAGPVGRGRRAWS